MKGSGVFAVLFISALQALSSPVFAAEEQNRPSACHCKPVITVAVDGDGRSDQCKDSDLVKQELKEVKSEVLAVKKQLGQMKTGNVTETFHLTSNRSSDVRIFRCCSLLSVQPFLVPRDRWVCRRHYRTLPIQLRLSA